MNRKIAMQRLAGLASRNKAVVVKPEITPVYETPVISVVEEVEMVTK